MRCRKPRSEPAGRVVSGHLHIGQSKAVGLFDRLIITIQGTSRARKDFQSFLKRLILQSSPCQFLDSEGKRPFVFDCVGTMEALRQASEHWSVVRFELAISASIGRGPAGGSGEETDKSKRARRYLLSPQGERQRIDAIEQGAPVDRSTPHELEERERKQERLKRLYNHE